MTEAFVYCWTDHKTAKLYVGAHKGAIDDGYIASGNVFLGEYIQRPGDFTRQVLAEGTWRECWVLEKKILQSVNARKSAEFYNRSNNQSCPINTKPNTTSFQKGGIPWNKGVTGYNTKPQTEYQKRMVSIANKDNKATAGMKWYNNGKVEKLSHTPIPDFTPGRLPVRNKESGVPVETVIRVFEYIRQGGEIKGHLDVD